MKTNENTISNASNRRSFLKTGLAVAGAATMGTGLLARARAQGTSSGGGLTQGDAAILRFLAAGEALEADFYTQYNELGGHRDDEVPGGSGNRIYAHALRRIDPNFSQYIHDITDDEMSHRDFLNAYLVSKGAEPVDLEPYRTLQGSTATGSSGKVRLTNLMQLTIDSSWWTRRPFRTSTRGNSRLSRGRITICSPRTTFRPLPTPRHSISRL